MFLFTFAGEDKIFGAISEGKRIKLTKMVVGYDPNIKEEDLPKLSSIPNKKFETDKLTVKIVKKGNEKILWATAFIPLEVGGFTYNLIGLYDEENTLVIVGKITPRYKPTLSEAVVSQTATESTFIDIHLSVGNVENLPIQEISNETSAFVTTPDFTAHIEDTDPHPTFRRELEKRLSEYGKTSPQQANPGKIWISEHETYFYDGSQWKPIPIGRIAQLDPTKLVRRDEDTTITGTFIFQTTPIFETSDLIANLNSDKLDGFDASQIPLENRVIVSNSEGKLDEGWLPTLLIQQYTFDKPFQLTSNAQGQLIEGLNADQVDGAEPKTSPTANAIIQANDQGKIDEGWLPTTLPTARDYRLAIATVNSNTSIEDGTVVFLVDASNGEVTLTLPSPAAGRLVIVKKVDNSSNEVTINPDTDSGAKIDGQDSVSLTNQYDKITLISDGSNWFII